MDRDIDIDKDDKDITVAHHFVEAHAAVRETLGARSLSEWHQ